MSLHHIGNNLCSSSLSDFNHSDLCISLTCTDFATIYKLLDNSFKGQNISVDVSKALSEESHDSLIFQLHKTGNSEKLQKAVPDVLKSHKIVLFSNQLSSWEKVSVKVLQCSNFDPLLFLVHINHPYVGHTPNPKLLPDETSFSIVNNIRY